jgi:signal transduction histidine kinase
LAQVLGAMVEESSGVDSHILMRAKEKISGLISLIGDLLDLSRIESGMDIQEPKAVQVDELLKGIVDFLDGFIDVESTPGNGSVFMVTLPLKQTTEAG